MRTIGRIAIVLSVVSTSALVGARDSPGGVTPSETKQVVWQDNVAVIGAGTANPPSSQVFQGGTLFWRTDLHYFVYYLARSWIPVYGSQSKALTDNVATNFADVAIPQTAGSNYTNGKIEYSVHCRDASNQAEQSGSVKYTCHNLAGTETCGFGTPDLVTQGDGTASLGPPVFTAAVGTDVAAFSIQIDCTGITPTTMMLHYQTSSPPPWTPK